MTQVYMVQWNCSLPVQQPFPAPCFFLAKPQFYLISGNHGFKKDLIYTPLSPENES